MRNFSGSRLPRLGQMAFSVGLSVFLTGGVWLLPAQAADELSIVEDIQMPDIRMPSVDVDVRIGERARPPLPPAPARIYPRGPFAAMTPPPDPRVIAESPAVAPHQIAGMLRATGYSLLGPVNRRGWVYTVAVLNPRGDDGRAVIDARTGAIIRFVPAFDVDARFNAELETVYGPPGPPPVIEADYANRRGALLDMRRSPRPPVSVPQTSQRSVPKPAKVAAAPTQAKTIEPTPDQKPASTTVGVSSASAPSPAAPELKLWPTQAMPDAQSME